MKKSLAIFLCFFIIFALTSRLYSCTAFYINKDQIVLVGNNEDWFNFNTRIWFTPAKNGNYGRVYFGFSDFIPQGGMNEKGLFFDCFTTEQNKVVNSIQKPAYDGNLNNLAMATCSSVEEVIKLFRSYNLEYFENSMVMFGDARGRSVIIEGDDFILNEGDYQICTNFYQSKTHAESINCWRYLKANKMLEENSIFSVELCKEILKAVHVDFTQYSTIYDLNKKKIYLYHYHNFENVVEIDLLEELAKGRQSYDIASLFPLSESFIESSRPKVTPINNNVVLIFLIISSLIFISVPFILILMKKKIMGTLADNGKQKFILFKTSLIVATVASMTLLIVLIALLQYHELFYTGIPQNLSGLSYVKIVFIRLPLLVIIMTVVMILFLLIVYYRKLWESKLRIFYFFIIVLLLINLGLLNYWNMLRI